MTPRPFLKSLLVLLAAFLASPLTAETTREDLGADVTAEVYKKASGDDLWIYRFDPPGHDPAKDQRPAAVFFFGGGWNGGSVKQFQQQARYLAGRGMVTFLADYRVKSRQDTAPDSCVADGKSAVRWIRSRAEKLGIDPDRIAAGGGSAGGHVAAAAGICDGLDDPTDQHQDISSKPNALLLFNPVYDNGPEGYGHDRVKPWFPAISPVHNISADDPPTIVFFGTNDNLVPVATTERFDAATLDFGFRHDHHSRAAIGQLRGVCGGDVALRVERWTHFRQGLDGGAGAHTLIVFDEDRVARASWHLNVDDLVGEPTFLDRVCG